MKKMLVGFIFLFVLSACDFGNNNNFTITFDSNEGSYIAPIDVEDTQSFYLPQNPEKEGYTFSGWYLDVTYTTEFNKEYLVINNVQRDLVVYAKWILESYKVEFFDWDGSLLFSQNFEYGSDLSNISITAPIREGYIFTGWSINLPSTMPTEDVSLVAQYDENFYEIRLYDMEMNLLQTIIMNKGTCVTLPDLPIQGYDFENWYLDTEFNTLFDCENVTSDIDVYGNWTIQTEMILNWNIGPQPYTLDPTLNSSTNGGDVINNTFEGLVREISGEVFPGIAQTWDISPDGKTITFHLRESNWSDGTPLTAHDFIYSWKRGMDPRTMSERGWIWEYTNIVGVHDLIFFDGYSDIDSLLNNVGIVAIDDYTLEVSLTDPTPYFISFMANYHFKPVKQEAVEAIGGADGLWASNPDLVVSNGPFLLTEYNVEGIKLIKNPEYWNVENVKIDIINGFFIYDATTAFTKFNTGELDFIPTVPSSSVPTLIETDDQFHIFPLLGTYYYSFNLDPTASGYDPIFDNKKLRTALSYSIDRQSICSALYTAPIPALSIVPPGFLDNENHDFSVIAGSYGLVPDESLFDDAVTLFAEAASELGMTVAELQAALNGKEMYFNTSETHAGVAQMIQQMWAENLGFTVVLNYSEWAVFQNDRANGDFDIARSGILTNYIDPSGLLMAFTQENAYNDSNFSNNDFDAYLLISSTTTDPTQHFQALYDAQAILMDEMPIIPIYHYTSTYYVKNYVKNWDRSLLNSLDFSRAYIEVN